MNTGMGKKKYVLFKEQRRDWCVLDGETTWLEKHHIQESD